MIKEKTILKLRLIQFGDRLERTHIPGLEYQKNALLSAIRIYLQDVSDCRGLRLFMEKRRLWMSALSTWKLKKNIREWNKTTHAIKL
ncbi:MAG: hypothetical protein JRJ62_16045 [Deltaproteobacteria bacterium]|nr:hypothetical protein [Deltaproteobacteria bacterium]